MRGSSLIPSGRLAFPLIGLSAYLLPFIVTPYQLHVLTMIAFYGFLGTAWMILSGYTGYGSFGHALFFGVGAYTAALLFMWWDLTPWLAIPLGSGFAALLAACIGYLCFRFGIRGHFFFLATIAFAEVTRVTFMNLEQVGAAWGLLIPITGDSIYYFQFHAIRSPYYYIMLTLLIAIVLVASKIRNSKFGYRLLSIREDEEAAEAMGVDTMRYKLMAFMISAAFTSMGGVFYTQYVLYIAPYTVMSLELSVTMVLVAVVGGLYSPIGPLIGAVLLQPLFEYTRVFLGGMRGLDLIAAGFLMMLMATSYPRGCVELFKRGLARVQPMLSMRSP